MKVRLRLCCWSKTWWTMILLWFRTNKLHDIFLFFWDLYLGLRGGWKGFSQFIFSQEFNVLPQATFYIYYQSWDGSFCSESKYICCVLSSCWQNDTIFGCFAFIDRDKNASLSLVSITFCGSCGAGWGEGVQWPIRGLCVGFLPMRGQRFSEGVKVTIYHFPGNRWHHLH